MGNKTVLAATRITIETCISLACNFWAVEESRILKKCRRQETVQARVSITYIMKAQGQTDKQIGRKFGKERSSVSHYKSLILTDTFTQNNIRTFINWCNDNHRLRLPELNIWIETFSDET